MVAAFELANQKVVKLESKKCLERKVDLISERTLIRNEHCLAYFNCPYCEASIQFSKAMGGGQSYVVALNSVRYAEIRVGQTGSMNNVGRSGQSTRPSPRKLLEDGPKHYSFNGPGPTSFGSRGMRRNTREKKGKVIKDTGLMEEGLKRRYGVHKPV